MPDGVFAAIFDLDGVLTSTSARHEQSWRDAAERFAFPVTDRAFAQRAVFHGPHRYVQDADGVCQRGDAITGRQASENLFLHRQPGWGLFTQAGFAETLIDL